MARRKYEPPAAHRAKIAAAAEALFSKYGTEAVTMDEIAGAAGYSKATLYVYFRNKEEIVGILVLESMKKLYDYIAEALEGQTGTRARYEGICQALVRYQEEYPYYFRIVQEGINIDFSQSRCEAEERETFRIGEEINDLVRRFMEEGIAAGELREDMELLPTLFSFWGMLSGLIEMAANKEAYIRQAMQMSRQEFLQQGFDTLYRSVAREEIR